jgi:hypothetical protein
MIKSGISSRPINNILRHLRALFRKARYENKVYCDALMDFEFVREHEQGEPRHIFTLAK